MKTISRTGLLRSGLIAAFALALGACVYDPGYGYVRGNGYYGDAYYGHGTTYYDDYYPGYYGYRYAPSIGVGLYYSNHNRYRGSHYGHSGRGYSHGGYSHRSGSNRHDRGGGRTTHGSHGSHTTHHSHTTDHSRGHSN